MSQQTWRARCLFLVVVGSLVTLSGLTFGTQSCSAQSRKEKVLNDREKVIADGFWIYNDFDKGLEEAKKSGKPIMVALRCLPCEECVKLDEELIEQHGDVKPLLEKFVRVRLVSANSLNLSLFQFDTDQSFAIFFLNADGTIYGRFGTRSDQIQFADDVSIEGLAAAMQGALEVHANFPANRNLLQGNTGPRSEFATPIEMPAYKGKYGPKLDYEGNVVQSCIHCHMIGDANKQLSRNRNGKLSEQVLFPYPHPRSLGVQFDPKTRGTIRDVSKNSIAASAGLRANDKLVAIDGRPVLSIADVQWALHQVSPQGGKLSLTIERDSKSQTIPLTLGPNWRRADDIAWRASSWELRRMAVGGLYFKTLNADERERLKLPADANGLYVEHAGEFAPHDQAFRGGIRKGDVLISFDGVKNFERETDLLRYALNDVKVGGRVPVVFQRGDKRIELELEMRK